MEFRIILIYSSFGRQVCLSLFATAVTESDENEKLLMLGKSMTCN